MPHARRVRKVCRIFRYVCLAATAHSVLNEGQHASENTMAKIASVLWAAMVAALGSAAFGGFVNASELKVFTSVALTSALDELAPMFEKATGNKLDIGYGLIADWKTRILAGASGDVIILSRPAMEELQKQNKFAADLVNIAGTPVAVAVRAGAPKPDITTVDAFKHVLLAARAIAYADPAKGAASGVYFAHVLERLGIAEQLKGKTILVPGAQAPEVVARGEAELGVAQASEIVAVAGAQLVGPLPGELASMTVFTAGIAAGSKTPEAAKKLIEFLTGPGAASRFKEKGFEPG
jgi:molybdate transport system substrate-binding protein